MHRVLPQSPIWVVLLRYRYYLIITIMHRQSARCQQSLQTRNPCYIHLAIWFLCSKRTAQVRDSRYQPDLSSSCRNRKPNPSYRHHQEMQPSWASLTAHRHDVHQFMQKNQTKIVAKSFLASVN